MKLQPVILCGGSGTRLWPLSRQGYPKQLLALDGHQSMLQITALRVTHALGWSEPQVLAPLVVSNEEYRFVSAQQLREVDVTPAALLLEPEGRNTAPALTLAAQHAQAGGHDPILLVMPADHVIADVEAFRAAVRRGARYADEGFFVTFGIPPSHAHTGYGYIRVEERLATDVMTMREFVEKPDLATAEQYVASGTYFWNSGMFMIKASVWMDEIARVRPEMAQRCAEALAGAKADRDFTRVDAQAFLASPSESIDYAVMEGLNAGGDRRGVVLPLDVGWSDVGAWSSLWDVTTKDANGNVLHGDVYTADAQDSLVFAESRLVACVGLRDAVVVETADAVLVAQRDRIESVKDLVATLKAEKRTESESHRKIHRPWGWYDSVDKGDRFQVKHIVVNPGAALSLQMHHHRAEHWVVVRGTARVTRGEEAFIVSENESTYIPLGVKHRLENPGRVPLEIIEIQSGPYLGEDDIVRFEDTYGRK